MFIEILKSSVLLLFVIITHRYSHPLGGAFYALFALLQRIPFIGKLFEKILNGPIKLAVVTKLAAWSISSSGMLLGIFFYYLIFGMPEGKIECWVLLFVSISAVINILYDFVLFQMDTFKEYHANSKLAIKRMLGEEAYEIYISDPKMHKSLSRSLFIDLYLPQFFKMLGSIGVFYYAMGHLDFFELNKNMSIPNLGESLKLSITLISFLDRSDYKFFTGEVWLICSLIASLLVFIYAAFFISFAQSMFSDEGEINLSELQKQGLTTTFYPIPQINPLTSNISVFNKPDNPVNSSKNTDAIQQDVDRKEEKILPKAKSPKRKPKLGNRKTKN